MKMGLHHTRRHIVGVRHGFTLVEALMAMVVAGVVCLAVYGGIAWGLVATRLSRENMRATQILTEKMEVVRLLTWDQITTSNIIPATFTGPLYATNFVARNSGQIVSGHTAPPVTYTGRVTIGQPPGWQLGAGYNTQLRVVTVQMWWNSDGLRRTRSISSYVSRYGIQNYLLN